MYGSEDQQIDTEEDLGMWSRFEAAADIAQGMFSMRDVEEAMKASNFNKGLGPVDSTVLSSDPGILRTALRRKSPPRSSAS